MAQGSHLPEVQAGRLTAGTRSARYAARLEQVGDDAAIQGVRRYAVGRSLAATLDAGDLDTGNPGGIVPGDRVKVVTEDGGPLNVRAGAGAASSVIGSVPNGTYLLVRKGPIKDADYKGNVLLIVNVASEIASTN